jgi:predicted nuclease of predicted toxin-antitoxin system
VAVRWLADECVSPFIVARLRDRGQDVLYIAETDPGAPDSDIVGRADRERRLLLTEDKDFGELVFRWHRPAPGIVLLRFFPEARDQKWPQLAAAIDRYGDALLGRYTVVENDRIRSRLLD